MAVAVTLGTSGARASFVVNLAFAGAEQTPTAAVGGTFIVQQIDPQSTGTGVIDSFVRIKRKGGEQGYNTSLSTPLDDLAGNFTHALQLSAVPIVNIGGVNYRQFLLDVNDSTGGSKELISLNQIQIFLANADTNAQSFADAGSSTTPPVIAFSNATQVFQMNAAGNTNFTELKLDYSLNSGSGSGDMFLYVQDSLFNPAKQFVILYSQFGNPPGSNGSDAGFEEWAVLQGDTQLTPAPSSFVLMGLGGFGMACVGLLRRMRAGMPATLQA
jgi:hypothetical protein